MLFYINKNPTTKVSSIKSISFFMFDKLRELKDDFNENQASFYIRIDFYLENRVTFYTHLFLNFSDIRKKRSLKKSAVDLVLWTGIRAQAEPERSGMPFRLLKKKG